MSLRNGVTLSLPLWVAVGVAVLTQTFWAPLFCLILAEVAAFKVLEKA